MAFLLIMAILLVILHYFRMWRLSKSKGIFGMVELTISEEGIHTKNDYGAFQRKWIGVKKIVETKKYFYLMFSRSMTIVAPKRAFESAEEMEAFRSLAEQYIKESR